MLPKNTNYDLQSLFIDSGFSGCSSILAIEEDDLDPIAIGSPRGSTTYYLRKRTLTNNDGLSITCIIELA